MGIFSGLSVIGGIVLMASSVVTGPAGLIGGGALLSGGVGGISNVIVQGKEEEKKDFEYGRFVGHYFINGGVAAATMGVGAGAAALNAGRVATGIAVTAASTVGSTGG